MNSEQPLKSAVIISTPEGLSPRQSCPGSQVFQPVEPGCPVLYMRLERRLDPLMI